MKVSEAILTLLYEIDKSNLIQGILFEVIL